MCKPKKRVIPRLMFRVTPFEKIIYNFYNNISQIRLTIPITYAIIILDKYAFGGRMT